MITSRWAGAGIIEKSDEDIYEYGLELLLYTILNTVVILGSAALVGKIAESLALLFVIMPLQSFGGGYHAKTHLRCFLIMYIGWWAVVFILPLITLVASIIIACSTVIIVFTLAPVPHVNVMMSARQRLKMRKLARLTVVIGAVVGAILALFVSERVGVAMAAGLGVVGLSMVVAHVKNVFGGKL
jgi:accessory gene regulator B